MSRKKRAHYVMCRNRTEENNMYKSMNIANNAFSKATQKKDEETFTELKNYPHWVFRLVR